MNSRKRQVPKETVTILDSILIFIRNCKENNLFSIICVPRSTILRRTWTWRKCTSNSSSTSLSLPQSLFLSPKNIIWMICCKTSSIRLLLPFLYFFEILLYSCIFGPTQKLLVQYRKKFRRWSRDVLLRC